ncbi:MAG: hypothetical protein ACRC9P_10000, partial [Bacteroides sp.]
MNADAITLCQDAAGLEPLADDWLLLGKPLHVSGSATEYRLTYSVEPTSKDRIAYIHFQLGQLRSYVKLTQVAKAYPKVRFELKVEKDGLSSWEQVDQITFIQPKAAEPTKEETYRVIWSDASADVDFMLSGGSIVWTEDITYQNPLDKVPVQKDELSGEVYKEFKVKPQQFSDYAKGSFVTKSETLHVVVDTHRDTPAIGSLQMTQLVADVVVETEVDPYYYLNGEKSNIKVKSNIPWTFYAQYNYGTVCDEIYSGDRAVIKTIDDIEIPPINDSDEQVIVGEVFREANTEGTLVEVVLSNECPSYTTYSFIYWGYFKFDIQSPLLPGRSLLDGGIKTTCTLAFPQDGREANCYVLNPKSGLGILIPLQAANGVLVDKYSKGVDDKLTIPGGFNSESLLKLQSTLPNSNLHWSFYWCDRRGQQGPISGLLAVFDIVNIEGKDYILVLPGMKRNEGNALLGINENNSGNHELWSWHIWVTSKLEEPGDDKGIKRMLGGILKGKQLSLTG